MFKRRKSAQGVGGEDGSVVSLFSPHVLGVGKKDKKKKDKKRKSASGDEHKKFIKEKISTGEPQALRLKKLDSMGLIPADVRRQRVPSHELSSTVGSSAPSVLVSDDLSPRPVDKAVPLNKPTERKDAVPVEELLERYAELAEIGSDVFRTEVQRTACETERGIPELRGYLAQGRQLRHILDEKCLSNLLDSIVRDTKSQFSADPLLNEKMANPFHKDKAHFEDNDDEKLRLRVKDSVKRADHLNNDFMGTVPVLVCGHRSLPSQQLWMEVEGRVKKDTLRLAYQKKFKQESLHMIKEVCTLALKANVPFARETNAVIAKKLLSLTEAEDWGASTIHDIQGLWQDKGLVEVLDSLAEEKQDKYRYIVHAIPRVVDKKYTPTLDDTFFITSLQSSVRELKYRSAHKNFYQFVGISRIASHNNRKWIHSFEDFGHVMFFADISTVEKAREAVDAAAQIKEMRSQATEFTHFMVFFHGDQELRAELKAGGDLVGKFTSYNGKDDAVEFVRERVLHIPAKFHGRVSCYELPLKGTTFVEILETGMSAAECEVLDELM